MFVKIDCAFINLCLYQKDNFCYTAIFVLLIYNLANFSILSGCLLRHHKNNLNQNKG